MPCFVSIQNRYQVRCVTQENYWHENLCLMVRTIIDAATVSRIAFSIDYLAVRVDMDLACLIYKIIQNCQMMYNRSTFYHCYTIHVSKVL